jgi:FkbM family methyltransferase
MEGLFYPYGSLAKLYLMHQYKEVYYDRVYDGVVAGRDDLVCVDVGANVGVVTEYLRGFSQVVHSLEPNLELFSCLAKRKDYNGWKNVVLHNVALADDCKRRKLYHDHTNLTGSSLVTVWDGKEEDNELVQCVTLERFMDDVGLDRIDFLKVDIEDAEEIVLCGDGFGNVADRVDTVLVEIHGFVDWGRIRCRMEELGYKWEQLKALSTIWLFTR